jgi:chemotaxis protein methyltransferase CheR
MTRADPRAIELELVIHAIYRRYGYDFRDYARVSLERRMHHRMHLAGMESMLELLPRILYDSEFASSLMDDLSITVTEMFRDPAFYQALREHVIPILKSYPYVKIWHAGCATGEEVYSMAIILHEEGLLDRAQLYATDFNQRALDIAKQGIYRVEDIHKATLNYNKTRPKASFRDYYHAKYRSAILARFLRENITFAHHNLTTDAVFATMNVVICRNVMIYFNRELQDRVLCLLRDSLCRRGFLALGTKETLEFSAVAESFEPVTLRQRIYQVR